MSNPIPTKMSNPIPKRTFEVRNYANTKTIGTVRLYAGHGILTPRDDMADELSYAPSFLLTEILEEKPDPPA